jgi:hypothetical protein
VEPNPALTMRYGTVDAAYAGQMAATDPGDDGPVWMVNLMSYRDVADYADGRASTISGQEADDRYAPFEALAAVGAEIVFVGQVESQLLGPTPPWHRVAVVKYPTRRAFIEMQDLPVFHESHVHKDAGMAETIVMSTVPIEWPAVPEDAPAWADVEHPPTEEDGYVAVLHVIAFNDGGAEGDMVSYQDHAKGVAVAQGIRIGGWLGVEGTIIGDGRNWDQARFNIFPSKAAFMAVVLDPDRLAAQHDHREVAIADTYTLILRPIIDNLLESVTGEALLSTT